MCYYTLLYIIISNMCNAITKQGSKCKRPNSFGNFCHYHRYLDEDYQPGAIENIKNNIQPKKIDTDNVFNWLYIINRFIKLFK